MPAELTGKSWEAAFGADSAKVKGYLPTLALTTGGRLHWWQNIVTVNKYGGKSETGMPDFGIVLDGRLHFIECKHEGGGVMMVGRLVANKDEGGEELWTGAGVKPLQAEWMDLATKSGATCWVAARLEVPVRAREKAAQMRLGGQAEPLPGVVTRLVPWPIWRALMAAAEDARRRKETPAASTPAADLAMMGWPCGSSADVLAALRGIVWTDYPFVEMGDLPGQKAPIREVRLLSYDGDKYARVRLPDGQEASVKLGYLHTSRAVCLALRAE